MTQQHCTVTIEEDGTKHGKSEEFHLIVLPDGDSKIFNRNAIKDALGENKRHIRCLVGELNGVRVYITKERIILTTRDLKL